MNFRQSDGYRGSFKRPIRILFAADSSLPATDIINKIISNKDKDEYLIDGVFILGRFSVLSPKVTAVWRMGSSQVPLKRLSSNSVPFQIADADCPVLQVMLFLLGHCVKKMTDVIIMDYSAELVPLIVSKMLHGAKELADNFCYEHGQVVAKSDKEGTESYRSSADQGHANAQFGLGVGYDYGIGVAKSYEEAVKWYRLAANQQYAPAQNNLGVCYLRGEGVQKDYKEAVRLFLLAASQRNEYAQRNLGDCYRFGYGVARSDEEAVKWYRLSADQGNADAKYALGQ